MSAEADSAWCGEQEHEEREASLLSMRYLTRSRYLLYWQYNRYN
ncbi:hypothetical protein [Anaerosporobacter faecicola]|nr:hypothetical protein [Anaerosporobacter faecicola]